MRERVQVRGGGAQSRSEIEKRADCLRLVVSEIFKVFAHRGETAPLFF